MVDQPTKVREVAWGELFPWLMLVRAVRIALMARVMILGTVGILATRYGWLLLGKVFSSSNDKVIASFRDVTDLWGKNDFWVDTYNQSAPELIGSATQFLLQAPIAIWQFMIKPFIGLFDGDLSAIGFLFLLLCCIWELLVWGLIGGAITRIAALKFTRDEAPGPIAALKHAARKLPTYSFPPLVALVWAAVFAIQLVVVGAAMRISFLALIAGILRPFVILLGLLMAILLLGLLVGWPMMWATVSVEGTDAFDALSRSFAYTYHRPFRLLWYVLFASLLAVISMFVVKLFASSAIALSDWSINWGANDMTMETVVTPGVAPLGGTSPAPLATPEPAPTEGPALKAAETASSEESDEPSAVLRGARNSIQFWKDMVKALASGYQAGFLWVAAVGVYLLMRRDIDGVQLNEVYVDPADEYGLPPLADEATGGVPEVVPGQPALPANSNPS